MGDARFDAAHFRILFRCGGDCAPGRSGSLPWSDPAMASASLSVWSALAYLAFFGTVLGFIWYYQGIKAIGATKVGGLNINFVPVSAIIFGSVISMSP